jgi:hypothetical protein
MQQQTLFNSTREGLMQSGEPSLCCQQSVFIKVVLCVIMTLDIGWQGAVVWHSHKSKKARVWLDLSTMLAGAVVHWEGKGSTVLDLSDLNAMDPRQNDLGV